MASDFPSGRRVTGDAGGAGAAQMAPHVVRLNLIGYARPIGFLAACFMLLCNK
jgi:hypothetical protein